MGSCCSSEKKNFFANSTMFITKAKFMNRVYTPFHFFDIDVTKQNLLVIVCMIIGPSYATEMRCIHWKDVKVYVQSIVSKTNAAATQGKLFLQLPAQC